MKRKKKRFAFTFPENDFYEFLVLRVLSTCFLVFYYVTKCVSLKNSPLQRTKKYMLIK